MNESRAETFPATLTDSLPEIFRGACKMLLDLAAQGIVFFFFLNKSLAST